LEEIGGDARVSVLKAVVTQSSSAIPIMPLYLAMLFKEMKRDGSHEGCIEQLYRLFSEGLYCDSPRLDDVGRLRMDDLEMRASVQSEVAESWDRISTDNLNDLSDYDGYKHEFLALFGFDLPDINYEAHVDLEVSIKELIEG
jgi:enoyl-[acyl-carrier protein] reductase/trans-2-enoyl-CoA reductase (NAD+)